MNALLEVVILPVSDPDRSLRFYRDQVGFGLDVDYAPVTLYATVFVLVNMTYVALCWEAVDRPSQEDIPQRVRRLLRMRSFITIGVFLAAALVSLKWPAIGMVLICICLIGYLRPDIPAPKSMGS